MKLLRSLILDWTGLAASARARPYLVLAFLVDGAFAFVFLVALQTYLPEQHGGGASLPGYALAAYGAAKLFGQLLGGRAIDRLGHKRALQVGLAMLLGGQGLLLFAAAWPDFAMPAGAGYGLGSAVLWPAIFALATDEFAEGERAKLTSAMTMTTGGGLATALGLGLLLPERFPYLAATLVAGGAVLVAFLAAAAVRVSPSAHQARAATSVPGLAALLREASHPPRLGVAAVVFLNSAAVGAVVAVFRAYGRDVLGVSLREEALYLAPAALVCAASVAAGGVLADRLGRPPVLTSGFLLVGLAVWALASLTAPVAVVVIASAGGMGIGLALPSVGAMTMDLARGPSSGAILAWFMAVEGLGQAVGPATAALLGSAIDTSAALRLVGALFVASSAMAFLTGFLVGGRRQAGGRSRQLAEEAQ